MSKKNKRKKRIRNSVWKMIFTTREKEEPLKEQASPGKTKAGSDNSDYDLCYSYYRNRTGGRTT